MYICCNMFYIFSTRLYNVDMAYVGFRTFNPIALLFSSDWCSFHVIQGSDLRVFTQNRETLYSKQNLMVVFERNDYCFLLTACMSHIGYFSRAVIFIVYHI